VGCDLVLVRHAVPFLPVPGGPDDFGRGLTDEGHAQAEQLAAELTALEPVEIVSSPYLRAVQTVAPAARRLGLPVRAVPALREWDSGLAPRPDFAEHYAASWADPGFVRPGGESLARLSERAVAALAELAGRHGGGTVVVGSHGTFVSRALAGFGVAVDWAFSQAMPMPAVYRLRFDGATVKAAGPGL
jgi:2,3-bisphosphoglycerate-dependent phosphoglycerate mutase